MLALAVLVLQSVVTSAVYAANENEEAVSETVVETVAPDPVSDESNDDDVVINQVDSEVVAPEIEEVTPKAEEPASNGEEPKADVEPEEKVEEVSAETETPVVEEPAATEDETEVVEEVKVDEKVEEFDFQPLKLWLNFAPVLFAATEPEKSDFDKFVEERNNAESWSCGNDNPEAGCVYDPRQYGLEWVEPGDDLKEWEVWMWKLVQPIDGHPGEYEISIAIKGQPKMEKNNKEICAVVVFDKSYSMWYKCWGRYCKWDKWNNAVQWAVSFSDSLNSLVPTAKIWLVTFAQTASIPVHLKTWSLDEWNFGNLEAYTNTHAWLKTAKKELDDNCPEDAQKNIVLISDWEPNLYDNSSNCQRYNDDTYGNDCGRHTVEYANSIRSGINIYAIWYETTSTGDKILKEISNGDAYFYTWDSDTSSIAEAFKDIATSVISKYASDAHINDNLWATVSVPSEPWETSVSYGISWDIKEVGYVYTFTVRIDPSISWNQATNDWVTLTYTDVDWNPATLDINDSASVNWVLPTCSNRPEKLDWMSLSENDKFTQSWKDGKLTPATKDWEYRELKDNEELWACQWTCNTAEWYEYDGKNNTCKKTFTVTYDVETNGWTSWATTEKVEYNSQADLTKRWEKTDWKFIWWNTESSSHSGLDSYTVIWNVTLYAIFKKDWKENTVTYTGDDTVAEISTGNDSCKIAEVYNNENQEKSCNVENKPTITCASGYSNGELYDSEWNVVVNITLSADATTYTAKCSPNDDTKYTVEYYTQNLDGSYSLTGTEEETWTTNTEVSINPDLNKYTWFIFSGENKNNRLTGKIEADGSLVLKVYYDRVKVDVVVNPKDPECEEKSEQCVQPTDLEKEYGDKVTLPYIKRSYTLTYKVWDWAPEVESQNVESEIDYYCKWDSSECEESDRVALKWDNVDVEVTEPVTYTAHYTGSFTLTVATWSDYQIDSIVYTFETWKDGNATVTGWSELTLLWDKTLEAKYSQECATGYHNKDLEILLGTTRYINNNDAGETEDFNLVCVSDTTWWLACEEWTKPEHSHFDSKTWTWTWNRTGYDVTCPWSCDDGWQKNKAGTGCEQKSNPWWGGGWGSPTYECKNLPANAERNNSNRPSRNTDYTYSDDKDALCTFHCKSGYTRDKENEKCTKSQQPGNGWDDDEDIEFRWQVSDKCSVDWSNRSEEEKAAYLYACENDITTIRDIEKARLGDFLTRAEMAKMISVFATKELWMKPNTSKDCSNFANSIASYNQEMKDYMVMSCQLELMWIHTVNYEPIPDFMPSKRVSRAEFGTVLSRVLWWNKYEWTNSNYYVNHLNALKENNIITNINPHITEYRAWVFLMLYRSVEAIKVLKSTKGEAVEQQVNEELQEEGKAETGLVVEYDSWSVVPDMATVTESGTLATWAVVEVGTGSVVEAQTGDTVSTTWDIAKETAEVETWSTNN